MQQNLHGFGLLWCQISFFLFLINSFFILCKPLLRINHLKPKYFISENSLSLSTSPFLFLSTSPFFCCFCFILISVWFYFVLQRATGRKLGFSERVVRIFFKPTPDSSLQAQGTQPQFIYSSFLRGWNSLSLHTCIELSKGAIGWLAGDLRKWGKNMILISLWIEKII